MKISKLNLDDFDITASKHLVQKYGVEYDKLSIPLVVEKVLENSDHVFFVQYYIPRFAYDGIVVARYINELIDVVSNKFGSYGLLPKNEFIGQLETGFVSEVINDYYNKYHAEFYGASKYRRLASEFVLALEQNDRIFNLIRKKRDELLEYAVDNYREHKNSYDFHKLKTYTKARSDVERKLLQKGGFVFIAKSGFAKEVLIVGVTSGSPDNVLYEAARKLEFGDTPEVVRYFRTATPSEDYKCICESFRAYYIKSQIEEFYGFMSFAIKKPEIEMCVTKFCDQALRMHQ